MKSKQEPTPTQETPWRPLSQAERTSGAEWLERTKADLRPASQEQQTRRVMKAYLEAPIETRHLAARKAAADYESGRRETDMEAPVNRVESYKSTAGLFLACAAVGMLLFIGVALKSGLHPADDESLSGTAFFCAVALLSMVFGAVLSVFIYPYFYDENRVPTPGYARLIAVLLGIEPAAGRIMCAVGRHHWDSHCPQMFSRCGIHKS